VEVLQIVALVLGVVRDLLIIGATVVWIIVGVVVWKLLSTGRERAGTLAESMEGILEQAREAASNLAGGARAVRAAAITVSDTVVKPAITVASFGAAASRFAQALFRYRASGNGG